ncbi:hypothetical protein E2562_003840 [Oryza meyeriana var. granulata]|uniref:Uncharacterized protein n=1 Tax=Oryza meyeriana var. granulata TaxID=110450 RepID=A0A6G1CYS3_9ORYZ|nr:hypothetical protein E2562_003840 [Oryza meyeriana var. granulata]
MADHTETTAPTKPTSRSLAAILPTQASSSQALYAYRSVGYFPDRVQAAARCLSYGGGGSSSCAPASLAPSAKSRRSASTSRRPSSSMKAAPSIWMASVFGEAAPSYY